MNRRASRILTVCAGAWLLVIWGQSCMPATHSGAESGALLDIVQAFLPHMTDHILRKCAHFGEYALLGVLTAARAAHGGRTFHGRLRCCPARSQRCATRRSSSLSPAAADRSRTSGSTRRAISPVRC